MEEQTMEINQRLFQERKAFETSLNQSMNETENNMPELHLGSLKWERLHVIEIEELKEWRLKSTQMLNLYCKCLCGFTVFHSQPVVVESFFLFFFFWNSYSSIEETCTVLVIYFESWQAGWLKQNVEAPTMASSPWD